MVGSELLAHYNTYYASKSCEGTARSTSNVGVHRAFPCGLGNRAFPGTVGYSNGQKDTMSTKNWKAIAAVGDEQLRHLLISATGKVAEGLEKGFPQYFGGTDVQVSREEIIRIAAEARHVDDLVNALKDMGVPVQKFGFTGTCKGSTSSYPYALGGYDTVRHGWGQYFFTSLRRSGETFEYKGAEWLVLWASFSRGSAQSFDRYTLIAVPVASLGA